jgi:arylsulfatase A-like enzyme
LTRLLLPCLLLVACQEPGQQKKRPPTVQGDPVGTTPDFYDRVPTNLIMISVDTFRRDHLPRYGDKDVAGFLGALQETGVPLDAHTTCSNWTYAGTTCTLRGAYNVENQFIPKINKETREPVPMFSGYLAGWLGEADYYSVISSGNEWLSAKWNATQGFDETLKPPRSSAEYLYNRGVGALEAAIDQGMAPKWYLHLHLMEPHAPYQPPDAYLSGLNGLPNIGFNLEIKDDHYDANNAYPTMTEEQQELVSAHMHTRYEAEIAYFDDQLFWIFADLDQRGLLDDALVVLWNDHGEQFWEHGKQSHAYGLHREENDGWAILWAKNIVPGPWSDPTVSIDLVPTILKLQGLDIPSEVTGMPLGERDPLGPRFATSVARSGAVQSVQKEDWKLIFNWSGGLRLYDLEADPGEQDNLYAASHPKAQELWQDLEPFVRDAAPLAPEYTISWPAGLD